ncbi:hypothetical protein ACSSS7_006096 [Eimeria intestinalis]
MGSFRTKEVVFLLFFILCPCWPPGGPLKVPCSLVCGRLPAEETSLHADQRHCVPEGSWGSFSAFWALGPAGALAAVPGKSYTGQPADRSEGAQVQQSDLSPRDSFASAQVGIGETTRDDQMPTTFCSGGLRRAFDCALRRVIGFGVRDQLIDRFKLPMVPLDVCQGDGLMDVEQCIPEDFVDAFPSDHLLDAFYLRTSCLVCAREQVVRHKRLIVGTMDLSVFPQLVADQANTTGFYPELVQAIARELTVIALQNAGLRRELVGERQLNISILEQPFSQRVRELKAAKARRWRYGEACDGKAGAADHDLQQLPVPDTERVASSGEGQPKEENESAPGLMFADSSSRASGCSFNGELSPWEGIPKDIFIAVAHVKFTTPMNLIAAVHRGEVHMTDVGTIASAYLPEKYNFLPLREVLEPSCSIGAWKSFFLLRDPASKARRARRVPPSADADQVVHEQATHLEDRSRRRTSLSLGSGDLMPDKAFWNDLSAGGDTRNGRQRFGLTEPPAHWDSMGAGESWEDKTKQTRKLFYKLFGVEPEGSSASSGQVDGTGGASGLSASRPTEEEALQLDERTLVKLHHVDHFTYSYLFPEDFRICSVRK